MNKSSKVYFRLFLMRFRKNYMHFIKNYNGKNLSLYQDNFINDNLKLAHVLYGDEGVRKMRAYAKKLTGC